MGKDNIVGRIGYELFFNGKAAFEGMSKMEKSFGRLKKVVMAVVAGKVVKDLANFGKEISVMSDRTGMSVSNLSRLRSSFISAGAGAKGFEKVIGHLNDGLMGLSVGNGEIAAKLAMFGIGPYSKSGRLKNEEELIDDLAEWAKKKKESGWDTQHILYYLRNYANVPDEMGVQLMEGREAFRSYREKSESKVGTVTEDETKRNRELNKDIEEFKEASKRTGQKMTAYWQPLLSSATNVGTWGMRTAGENPRATGAAMAGFKVGEWLSAARALQAGVLSLKGGAGWMNAGEAAFSAAKITAWTTGITTIFGTIVVDTFGDIINAIRGKEMDGFVAKAWYWLFENMKFYKPEEITGPKGAFSDFTTIAARSLGGDSLKLLTDMAKASNVEDNRTFTFNGVSLDKASDVVNAITGLPVFKGIATEGAH